MALAHRSIATINSPEFINLQPFDINPLMSSCDIKVFYLGENRNGSFISKDVAAEMAKTLRGAPIVGYYKKDKQDFADHGQQMVWDDTGIHFNCLTKPYGFVSPVAKVWFQDFQDQDDFGNSIVRTYLMTTGFLWTGQFEEAQQVLQDEGKPHSMELDEKSLQGQWSKNIKKDMDFFIINDAVISKLCILGDDVQPCYEGSSIAPSQVNTSFTLDNKFKQTLFKMMQQLTEALEGGTMADTKEKNLLNEKQKKMLLILIHQLKILLLLLKRKKKKKKKTNSRLLKVLKKMAEQMIMVIKKRKKIKKKIKKINTLFLNNVLNSFSQNMIVLSLS